LSRKPIAELSPEAPHHLRLIHTGFGILDAAGVRMPDGTPLEFVHPFEDEALVIFPGLEGEHPFTEIYRERWLDCYFVVGYSPRFVNTICQPGAVMVIRRFKEQPPEHVLGRILATDWQPLFVQ